MCLSKQLRKIVKNVGRGGAEQWGNCGKWTNGENGRNGEMRKMCKYENLGNGKWEMGNGKWEMGNGKWEMGNEEGKIGKRKY